MEILCLLCIVALVTPAVFMLREEKKESETDRFLKVMMDLDWKLIEQRHERRERERGF